MEQAILKTLVYADLFDYPMKAWEIHKWLISKKSTLFQVENALKKASLLKKIKIQGDYYVLKGRKRLVANRLENEIQSAKSLTQARIVTGLFKLIPWIKLMGVSGSLAMENSDKESDIDLFIVTSKNRLWLTRVLVLGILAFLGKRRRRLDTKREAAGKYCLNLLLEDDQLSFKKGNIYLAHEILQLKVLWDRKGTYARFLDENEWVFKILPNWTGTYQKNTQLKEYENSIRLGREAAVSSSIIDVVEVWFRWLQKRYMGAIRGKEKVETGALFLHPNDQQEMVIERFMKKQKVILLKH